MGALRRPYQIPLGTTRQPAAPGRLARIRNHALVARYAGAVMPHDPFYTSKQWRTLRLAVLRRDRHACTVPGCGRRATIVDHIIARSNGGSDSPTNLRSLCVLHDNGKKENQNGERRGLSFRGHDSNGNPIDPAHPWNAKPSFP